MIYSVSFPKPLFTGLLELRNQQQMLQCVGKEAKVLIVKCKNVKLSSSVNQTELAELLK